MRAEPRTRYRWCLFARRTTFFTLFFCLFSIPIHAENLAKCFEGEALLKAGDPSAAIKQFTACISEGVLSNESLAITYRNIGFAYRRLKDPSEAIVYFNKAIALHPNDPWSDYINRGNAYDDQGRFERAFADYDTALKLKPGFGEVYYNRGVSYENQKKFDRARNEFIEAYRHGLRSDLLYGRFVVYGLIQSSGEQGDGKSSQQTQEDRSDAEQ